MLVLALLWICGAIRGCESITYRGIVLGRLGNPHLASWWTLCVCERCIVSYSSNEHTHRLESGLVTSGLSSLCYCLLKLLLCGLHLVNFIMFKLSRVV